MTPPDPPLPKVPPASRRLLARVRDVMAGPGDAGSRLHRIVAIIAADMVAEVCSIYVRREGDILELEIERIGVLRNRVVVSKEQWRNFAAGAPTGPMVRDAKS